MRRLRLYAFEVASNRPESSSTTLAMPSRASALRWTVRATVTGCRQFPRSGSQVFCVSHWCPGSLRGMACLRHRKNKAGCRPSWGGESWTKGRVGRVGRRWLRLKPRTPRNGDARFCPHPGWQLHGWSRLPARRTGRACGYAGKNKALRRFWVGPGDRPPSPTHPALE